MEMVTPHPFRSADAKDEYLDLYDRRAALWPVDSESRIVYTAHGKTFVRISGPAGAPPLVLLPGFGAHSLMWAPNVKALSECYQTFAVDNICDVGRSVDAQPIHRPDDFADWLDGLFKALRLAEGAILMGASFGAWLASQYAVRFPDRLRKLVLLAPAATVLPLAPGFLIRGMLSALPVPHFGRSMMSWLFADLKNDQASGELFEITLNDMTVAARCFKPRRMMVQPTVLTDEQWAGIRVPTLCLVGENEKICAAGKAVARLDRVAPQVHAEIISNAGNDLSIVQAEIVNQKVLAFLNGA